MKVGSAIVTLPVHELAQRTSCKHFTWLTMVLVSCCDYPVILASCSVAVEEIKSRNHQQLI